MADAVDVLAQKRLAARNIQPDKLSETFGNFFDVAGLQGFALVETLPIEAGATLCVAVIRDKKDQVDGLPLTLRELLPRENLSAEHA
jgi:hypothetical protein